MYSDKPVYRRFPKVPIERRAAAFLIDFLAVWVVSSLGGNWFVQCLLFIIAWLVSRVFVVEANQGQSLGRYALDMKVIDPRYNKIPGLVELAKREAIVGFGAMLAAIGLSINLSNSISMLLLITPLLVDCGAALADEEFNQAFHDRFSRTVLIQTRRGYSLDLRLKKILDQVRDKMRK